MQKHLHSKSLFFQPKLSINQPNHIYEQEADAMADKVMRMENSDIAGQIFFKSVISPIQRKCAACEEEEKLQRQEEEEGQPVQLKPSKDFDLQRKCAHCDEEEKVQMKEESGASGGMTAPTIVHDVINSGGQSMDAGTRSFMETRFGYDFGGVKIHNDSLAHQSSAEINALAYTHGNHVVFGEGRYQPDTNNGKQLLAHELTHVMQQNLFLSSCITNNFIQCSHRKSRKHRKEVDLEQLAKWPDEARVKWKNLDPPKQTLVIWQIAANYGDDFARQFLKELKHPRSKHESDQYYGRGVGPKPAKLVAGGFALVQRDSVNEWWVHPSGLRITRATAADKPGDWHPASAPAATPSAVATQNPSFIDPTSDLKKIFGEVMSSEKNVTISEDSWNVNVYLDGTFVLSDTKTGDQVIYKQSSDEGDLYDVYNNGTNIGNFKLPIELD